MKRIFTVVLSFFISLAFSQNNNSLWKSYFSYNKIIDISSGTNNLYVATENAFFKMNKATLEMETFSTVDGLSGNEVTCGHYSTWSRAYVLAYSNGLLQVYDDVSGEVTSVVEIKDKETISGERKVINHMLEYNGLLYISCDFGISVYDIDRLEFDDTYYLGPNGAQMEVKQTAVYQGYLYAATSDGIYRAMVSQDNILDFENWELVTAGGWSGIALNGGNLVAVTPSHLYKYNGSTFDFVMYLGSDIEEIRVNDNKFIITRNEQVLLLDNNLTEVYSLLPTDLEDYPNVRFNSTYLEDGILYVGTEENGMLAFAYPNVTDILSLEPPGPYYNNAFSINLVKQNLWVVFGAHTNDYDPAPLNRRGISIYKPSDDNWKQIPYDSLLGASNLVGIAYNPNKVNEVYVSSFYNGLLKIKNEGEEISLFNQSNSSLQSHDNNVSPNNIRISGAVFDRDDNMWMLNSVIHNAIKVMKADGSWGSYSVQEVINVPTDNLGFKEMSITRSGYKFITTANYGLLGFYENNGSPRIRLLGAGEGNGNLPHADVRAVALDQNNQLWIGTIRGLRVLYNTGSFFDSSTVESRQIIITEAGEASELLYQQYINDIFVDGANNKWIGTADSGAFYVSSNGQETYYHFTTDNSPLPSNNVNQIVVNKETGEVFFATDKGIVSFIGTATGGKETLSEVYAYPNPVRPQNNGVVTITNLSNDARVKISDVAGNLVFDGVSSGGSIQWNLTAFNRYKVSSGVYLVLVSSEDGEDTAVCKIMVVR